MTVVQRLEMVRRIGLEIDYDAVELGTDGRQLRLQLEELLGGNDTARELIVRDYHANPEPPSKTQVAATLAELDGLSDTELLDFTALSRVFGYPSTAEAQDSALSARATARWPTSRACSSPTSTCWSAGSARCRGLLAASATDLQSVEGHRRHVGTARPRGSVAAGRVDDRRPAGVARYRSADGRRRRLTGRGLRRRGGASASANGTAAERRLPNCTTRL